MIRIIYPIVAVLVTVQGESVVDVAQDIYKSCLQDFSLSCVRPKTLHWLDENSGKSVIKITEDLALKKKFDGDNEVVYNKDIIDRFEDFLQSHDLVAKLPSALSPSGPFGQYIPRNFEAKDISVPLATGRSSKLVKRVIFPFLLGLKFKTAIIVPLALALIALKTWKALTLGLLSLVLTGAIAIFSKLMGPKAPAYEVLHYQPHLAYPHVDVVPSAVPHPVYVGRSLDGQELAYRSHLN